LFQTRLLSWIPARDWTGNFFSDFPDVIRHFAPDINWLSHKEHVSKSRESNGDFFPDTCKHKPSTVEVRVDQGPVIQTLPVQSIICKPANRLTISGKNLEYVDVAGVAWSGAGRGICRVEVSLDGGKTFTAAELVKDPGVCKNCPSPEAGMGRNWSWTQFHLKAKLPTDVAEKLKAGKSVDLAIYSKAIDGDFNAQPEKMDHGWNVLGICVNHWSKVNVKLDPALSEGTTKSPPSLPKPGSPFWGDGVAHAP
jgi:sulfite oxidase